MRESRLATSRDGRHGPQIMSFEQAAVRLPLTAQGGPAVILDWKSDVAPALGAFDHYCAQVRAYLEMTHTERGLIVLMSSGAVIPALPTKSTENEAS